MHSAITNGRCPGKMCRNPEAKQARLWAKACPNPRPTARWGGGCGRSHCRSADRWQDSTDRSPSTGARGGQEWLGISWPWCCTWRRALRAGTVWGAWAGWEAAAVPRLALHQETLLLWRCFKSRAPVLRCTELCGSTGAGKGAGRAARAQSQAAVRAPGMVSLSATSSCCIWAWLITPSSSATTPMGLPVAMAVLAILAAFS